MIKEFREFILRGNLVDLAVAVVIGTAFAAVVTALVADVITPLIAAFGGEPDFSRLKFMGTNSAFPSTVTVSRSGSLRPNFSAVFTLQTIFPVN